MMSEDQSVTLDWRNVHFFDGSTGDMLGGPFQNGSVTQGNFISMLNMVLLTWLDSIKLSDEPVVRRLPPYRVGGRETDFDGGVRARDGKCVVTGTVNLAARAAHSGCHSAPIDSNQNGLLLLAHIHQLFDTYATVNHDESDFLTYGICNKYALLIYPYDNYKIVSFIADSFEVDGRTLDPVCRDPANPNRVSDHLFRWHFRHSVLKNMRKAREPPLEHDFPPGN
ncbi:uncharacterized protein P174DRAFT_515810 [Aspergillus novofumigatus IBT 16806]|uniref:HNH nuclease domain-containing protein n=1 Tax=Aspergillus novofumigatus (strain IBT 16806) TaxID=1392255 RepID=A0A2I1BWM5_ASPN1|nr:uncharacterized protein P174DRAFT_515810 [Aspergillus novofumigatus IBT 16806]PKX89793.1 hypothetical protein P174DRAFT_515810 [Aspergillus novofumigatus IBT 16806]